MINLKNFLRDIVVTESFLGKNYEPKSCGYLLGFRKGFVVYDLEKAINTLLKVLNLIKYLKRKELRILFVGCPIHLEIKTQELLVNSSHSYISFSNWVSGSLSNKKQKDFSPNLVVLFDCDKSIFNIEIMKNEIPSIFFIDACGDFKAMDFPIVLNTKSEAARNMFLLLVKASI